MENHLAGLPEHGVLLTGTPENPILENRSGRAVIAYRLKKAGQNGHGPAPLMFLAFSGQPAGISDGDSVYVPGNVPVNPVGRGHGIYSVPILPDLPHQYVRACHEVFPFAAQHARRAYASWSLCGQRVREFWKGGASNDETTMRSQNPPGNIVSGIGDLEREEPAVHPM
jgi:hypothetical protein